MCGIYALLRNSGTNQNDFNHYKNLANKGQHRGPDESSEHLDIKQRWFLVFHRLCIVDQTSRGLQPFKRGRCVSICNGEIYNFRNLIKKYNMTDLVSDCDSEVIIPLFNNSSCFSDFAGMVNQLDGVFAFVIVGRDLKGQEFAIVARDPFGVRSLYVGHGPENEVVFASEAKMIEPSYQVKPILPGTVSLWKPGADDNWEQVEYIRYYQYSYPCPYYSNQLKAEPFDKEGVCRNIKMYLSEAVEKRLMSDRPIGALLSGGLDSSIIVSLLADKFDKLNKNQLGQKRLQLHTFSVGLENSVDLTAARSVVEYLNKRYHDIIVHHEVLLSNDDMLNGLEDTICQIESFDVTTVRASTPMYLLSKYIKKNTDITVLFSGEGSDELSGSYLYFHHAPNAKSFYRECCRLLKDLHYFDVLRCDKSTAGAGLEVRVPFLDKSFVEYYMSIPSVFKMPRLTNHIEKYLLRNAFRNDLPEDIAWRTKEGMSDGVSSSKRAWFEIIQDHVGDERIYYKSIVNKYYPGMENIIPYQWMPKWVQETTDPSGRKITF